MRMRLLDLVMAVIAAVVLFGVFGPGPGEGIERASDRVQRVGDEVRAAAPERVEEDLGGGRVLDRLRELIDAEDIGNVLMFVPFGLYLPLRHRRLRWWTVPIGAAVSAAIELTQLVFLSWRTPSLADVAWNTVGTAVGLSLWLGGYLLLAPWRRHAVGQRPMRVG